MLFDSRDQLEVWTANGRDLPAARGRAEQGEVFQEFKPRAAPK